MVIIHVLKFMNKTIKFFTQLLLFALIASCGKEEFASVPRTEKSVADKVETFTQMTCSNSTLVKPPVDILFVVDNSPSSSYLTQDLKNQIAKTISSISQEFDYHILVAPLLPVGNEGNLTGFQLITSSLETLNNPVSLNIKSPSAIEFFQATTGFNQEQGFQRVKNIINANRANNIFRQGAYTLAVMISNGDDTDSVQTIGGMVVENPSVMSGFKNDFQKFTKKYADNVVGDTSTLLKAEQFRFLSVVTFSTCQAGAKANNYYKSMSGHLYTYSGATDQSSRSTPDSYDICTDQYSSLFSSVNNSIRQLVVNHKYDFWPITTNTSALIDGNDIEVSKLKKDGTSVVVPKSNSNGFQYVGARTNQNTRYAPTPGEPKTGLFVQLFGTGRLEFPDCIVIKSRTPTEYFGYIVIPNEPKLETVVVRVRGQNVEKSGPNGWTYEGFKELQNIKVTGPNGEASTPESKKTGYFIKLNGSSIYSSGDSVEVYFEAAPL